MSIADIIFKSNLERTLLFACITLFLLIVLFVVIAIWIQRHKKVFYILLSLAVISAIGFIFALYGKHSQSCDKKKIKEMYASITEISDKTRVVTATQYIDFITLLDGREGKYIGIDKYEVKAGYDSVIRESITDNNGNSKVRLVPKITILSCQSIKPSIYRNTLHTANFNGYEKYLKPVNIAYENKAKDYAVQLNLLKRASENAIDFCKVLYGNDVDVEIPDIQSDLTQIQVPYVPLHFNVSKSVLDREKISIANKNDAAFSRDSLTFNIDSTIEAKIRVGYTGMHYDNTYKEFAQNVIYTNKNEVEAIQYFDPLTPRTEFILGFAQDYYRNFFILKDGRLYYLDIINTDDQSQMSKFAQMMIYMAISLKGTEIQPYQAEYEDYINTYYDTARSLKDNFTIPIIRNSEKLKTKNILRKEDETVFEENVFCATSGILGDTTVNKTGNEKFDMFLDLYQNIKKVKLEASKKDEWNKAKRMNYLSEISNISRKASKHQQNQLKKLYANLEAWYIQNNSGSVILDDELSTYRRDIHEQGNTVSKDLMYSLTDAERNEYYRQLFVTKIQSLRKDIDTAEKRDDILLVHKKNNLMFAYTPSVPEDFRNDGKIDELIRKRNNEIPLRDNCFILVFTKDDWDLSGFDTMFTFVNDAIDSLNQTIYAIVLDDCTIRLFPKLDSADGVVSTVSRKIKDFIGQGHIVRPIYFSDWKTLKISESGISFCDLNFKTKHLFVESRIKYYDSNNFTSMAAIGNVLFDLQNEFMAEPDYHYKECLNTLVTIIKENAYDLTFRPSPRITIDNREKTLRELNY